MAKMLKILMVYGKVRITFFVAISGMLGFILANGEFSIKMILPVLGVFILSCGASAFNQWQEHLTDAKMRRTMRRPIPAGQLSITNGFIIASMLSLIGLGLLFLTGSLTVFVLGIFALVWYNLVYTPLKKKTSLAVIPGALIGSISPAIGWVAGGGSYNNPQLWALLLFFFIWQIPHFWLLLIIYENDYREAGFPVLTDIFSREQLTRITYIWIAAMTASGLIVLLFSGTNNLYTTILLLTAGFVLLWRVKYLVRKQGLTPGFRFAFMDINIYVLAVTVLLSADKLIR